VLRIPRAIRVTLAAAVVTVALASCGGSDQTSSDSSTSSATAANLQALKQQIDAAKQVPQFSYAGAAMDARAVVKGKSVVNVPWGTAVDYPVLVAEQMTRAAKEIGIDWETASVKGPDQWAQATENAVARDPSLLSLLILDPRAVRPQIQNARSKGIDVSSLHFWDSSQADLAKQEDLTSWVGIDYLKPARTLADWTIADSGGKADVLLIGGPDFTFNDPVIATMRAEYAKYCPGCNFKVANIPAADWASKIPTTVVAEVQKNPNLGYVIPFSDPAAPSVIDGLRQANATGRVKVIGYGAEPFVLDMVRKGDVAFDCGYSVVWTGYAFVDQLVRTLDGSRVDSDIKNGMRCFDQSNVQEAGNPAVNGEGFGDAYLGGYRKLWGLQR
jgi:ribose transport system substrate-binding protein